MRTSFLSIAISVTTALTVLTPNSSWARLDDRSEFLKEQALRDLTLANGRTELRITYSADQPRATMKIVATSNGNSTELKVSHVEGYRDGGTIEITLEGGATLYIPKDRAQEARYSDRRSGAATSFSQKENAIVSKIDSSLSIAPEKAYDHYIVAETNDRSLKMIITFPVRVDAGRLTRGGGLREQNEVIISENGAPAKSYPIIEEDGRMGSLRTDRGDMIYIPRDPQKPIRYSPPKSRDIVDLKTRAVFPDALMGESSVRINWKHENLTIARTCKSLFQ